MVEARCVVRAAVGDGRLERVWGSYGYDEISWTATPRGRRNTAALRELAGPMVVRAHNVLTSGSGRGLPHWSSGNVYHQDPQGNAVYDWSQVDPVFDVWVGNGMVPLVELGFCPQQLTRPSDRTFHPMPSLYGEYESWGWASPPRDDARWSELIEAVARHFLRRYGEAEVSGWWWEFWNEPDIAYWQGTTDEYCHFYDVTVAALRRVLPSAKVGGPATTGGGTEFLAAFLDHCLPGREAPGNHGRTPLDFVSFHTKGAPGFPRTYGPLGPEGALDGPPQSPSTAKMQHEIAASLEIIRSHPELADVPVFVDECDPGVPAHMGVFDNRNYAFRNTEYYAVFLLQLLASLATPRPDGRRGISLATAWTWYMEGDRWFEGTRSFFTAEDVPTPVTNAYRMLAMVGDQRLAAAVERDGDASVGQGTLGALASRRADGGTVTIVWHHDDDQYARHEASVAVELVDLPQTGGPVRVREYLIDDAHSNSHGRWRKLGSPQDPTPAEVASIREGAGLDLVAEETLERCPATLRRRVSLRCPAAALIEVVPA